MCKQFPDAFLGQPQHGVELISPERMPLGRSLYLDKRAAIWILESLLKG